MNKSPKKYKKLSPMHDALETIGKLPQCNDIEEAVVGACLLDHKVFPIVSKILAEADFYQSKLGLVFGSMLDLNAKMIPIDFLTVTEDLQRKKQVEAIGGSYYLVELTNRLASAANVEYHARIVKQKAIEREVIRICQETAYKGFQGETDSFELLDSLQSELLEISKYLKRGKVQDKVKVGGLILKEAFNVDESEAVTGIPTGLIEMDKLANGIEEGDFMTIAARQKMGKTALAQTIVKNIMESDMSKKIRFYTFEDTQKKLQKKLACKIANLPAWQVGKRRLTEKEMKALEQALELINDVDIEIIEARGMDALAIRADMLTAANNKGLDITFLDYFQRIPHMQTAARKQEHDAFKMTSNLLADTAVEVCPIVCMAQLLKPRKGLEAEKPVFSDMRGGSALMDDCHKAWIVYRHEYYQLMSDVEGNDTKNRAEIILSASRDYGHGIAKVGFEKSTATFFNLTNTDDVFSLGESASIMGNSRSDDGLMF